jgi:uncharacterized protein involved in outer membrane biogenesis
MVKFPFQRFCDFFGKRPIQRTFIGLAAFLLLFAAFGYAALPGIVKSQLEKVVAEKLHRQLTVGAVDVQPFALALTLRDVKLMEPAAGDPAAGDPERDAPFAGFDALSINLSTQSIWRLAPVVQELRLVKPYVHLVRKDAHHYNVDDLIAFATSPQPPDEPTRFSLYNIQIEDGRVEFEDRPAKTTHAVTELTLNVPFLSSLPSQVQVFVEPLLSAKVNGTPFSFQGKARPFAEPREAVLDLQLKELDLTRYIEYLPFKPHFKVPSARFDMQLRASFVQPSDKAPVLKLDGSAALRALRVTSTEGKPLLKLPELTLELRDTEVFGERIALSRLVVNGLEVDAVRNADGLLDVQKLLPGGRPTGGPRVTLDELALRGAALRYTDEYGAHPLQAGVEKLDLSLRKLDRDPSKRSLAIGEITSGGASLLLRQKQAGAKSATAAPASGDGEPPYALTVQRIAINNWSARLEDNTQAKPAVTTVAPLELSVQDLSTVSATPARVAMKAAVNQSGQLALNGSLGLAPFQAELTLDAKSVDLLPLQPYIADKANLRLTRASLSGNGKLELATADGALQGGFKGDLTLGNFATVDKLSGDDFLRGKSLFVGGMDMRLEPFVLTVQQIALSDFFARVIISPQGRINLQDILRGEDAEHKSLTGETPGTQSMKSTAPPAKPAGRMPPIAIRKVTLQGGRVRFTDNFIRPNYSATLADFGGSVTGLSSDPAGSAGVDLRGKVSGAPLMVAGRINPLRGDLFLDIKAEVRGMELAPLSAYSSRYVGYGIEKGKLSFEVAYHIDKRTLNAENRLILDQLTFGEKVESPSATTLPVQFAVSLLSDSNGVIDINMPISGSLDDPQFSVGGLIARALGNLILKAVTQPFVALGALFGGGAELSSLDLDAGRTAISPAAEARLQTLAKALADRPALKLDVAGRVAPETDGAGLKRVAIERKVRALKTRDLQARGETPEPGSVTVSADEYPALLKRVYRDEKFPKPRNLVGLAKDLPVEEMEKLMLANTEIDEDDLIALGNQRAQTVKNWLQKQGQVPTERMFIVAPKMAKDEAKGGGVGFALR